MVVTWTGPLIVEPLDDKPAELAGPDDALLTMTGRPVHMARTTVDPQTGQKSHETGSAASVDYLTSTELIHLRASAADPLVLVESDKLGRLEGSNLLLNQHEGVGQAIGPGRLIANVDTLDTGAPKGPATTQPATPKQMTITWTDRVDLAFFLRSELAPQPPGQSLAPSIAALKHALFVGHVQVQHPELALSGEQIALDMQQPQPGARPLPSRILADGHAAIAFAAPPPPPLPLGEGRGEGRTAAPGGLPASAPAATPLAVTARQIQIDLARAAAQPGAPQGPDRVEPHRFIARGDADARRPGQRLRADLIDAALYNPAAAPPPLPLGEGRGEGRTVATANSGATGGLPASVPATQPARTIAVRTLLATTNVRVEQADPVVSLTADRLLADVPHDSFELFGTPDGTNPAVVVRPDGTLRADHLVMAQTAQTLHVPGPGTLTYVQVPTQPATPGVESAKPRGKDTSGGTTLHVSWHDSMDFNNRLGQAHFLGRVVSDAQTDLDTHHLTAQDLAITFTPNTTPGVESAKPRDSMAPDAHSLAQGGQRITNMIARQDAAFQSESWTDKPGGKLATRLLLKGQVITFENTKPDPAGDPRQFVTVPGPGTLLFEDYRPDPDANAPAANPPNRQPPGIGGPTHVTGKGATLFVWNTKLVMDAFHNHMTMEDAVQMVHRPTDATDVVQLDCRRLTADLKPVGGLDVWMKGHAPKPQFTSIDGDRSVRVLSGKRTILADHLHYNGADQTTLLTSDPGHMAQVMEEDNPNAYSAETLRWDLTRNRFEAIAPGPGTVVPRH
jgi:hypothetical protein